MILNGAVEVLMGDAPPAGHAAASAGAPTCPPKARPAALAEKKGMIGRGSGTSGTVILSAPPADMMAGKRTILERGEVFGEISALSPLPRVGQRAGGDAACACCASSSAASRR